MVDSITEEDVVIDSEKDEITIYGVKYAGYLFRQFSSILPLKQPFCVEKREDGVLWITRL